MPKTMPLFIAAGNRPWAEQVFRDSISRLPGRWRFAANPQALDKLLRTATPRYIFFLHWSSKVPDEWLQRFECVCFHMTDVPYGRGGTPLQNLILRGHRSTRLTALRMSSAFDAGPVYMKRPLSLSGRAEEIYMRASRLSVQMIREMIRKQPTPKAQVGDPVLFQRRKPEESAIPSSLPLDKLFDFIRMLDAPGYPKAFLQQGGYRYEFENAKLHRGQLTAQVTIHPIERGTL